ncbi:MAG: TIGR02680 family protein [Burkholderiales bacterium]
MTDSLLDTPAPAPERPALPEPHRARWQPLRLGLVELFHYDSEEFWFRDGHLLLRGNNGTGKSKVLSLTLPFLFDAQLRSSRIEPDGDSSKKMAWNLLMNSYPRRIGYAWIEFGRIDEDGTPRYLTLGAGLSAVAARAQVESWFFMLEGGGDEPTARIGRDLWLTSDQRVVLTRERLREAIEGRGQVFETTAAYRRAVDERLFHLGPRRYDALMDTLIQLRQPQLSKKPDEAGLSHALTEALPPMPQELLTDVAEALNQLEEDRRQLDELKSLARAVERFDQRYRVYAGMLTRRQARELRQAQTDFDAASQVRNHTHAGLQAALATETLAQQTHQQADLSRAAQRERLETLQSDPINQDANRLEIAEKEAARRAAAVRAEEVTREQARGRWEREQTASRHATQRAAQAGHALLAVRTESAEHADAAGLAGALHANPLAALVPNALAELAPREFDAAPAALRRAVAARSEQLALLVRRHAELQQTSLVLAQRQEAQRERQAELDDAAQRRGQADAAVEQSGQDLVDAWSTHCASLVQLRLPDDAPLHALHDWVVRASTGDAGDNPAQQALQAAQQQASVRHAARQVELDAARDALERERHELDTEHAALSAGRDAVPPAPPTRAPESRAHQPGAPLWQLVDFQAHAGAMQRAGLEAALEASGLLDAWVTPDGALLDAQPGAPRWLDSQWAQRPAVPGPSLRGWLRADVADDAPVSAATVERLLASVSSAGLNGDANEGGVNETAEAWIAPDGRFRLGTLAGAWRKPQAVYIGHAARAAARRQRLVEIAQRLESLNGEAAAVALQFEQLGAERAQAEREWRGAPSEQALRHALMSASTCAREVRAARTRLDQADAHRREAEQARQAASAAVQRDADDMNLPAEADALAPVDAALQRFNDAHYRLVLAAQEWRRAQPELLRQQAREAETLAQLQEREEKLGEIRIEAEESKARFEVLRDMVGAQVDGLRQQLAAAREAAQFADTAERAASEARRLAGEARARASAQAEAADAVLQQRSELRSAAVARLQQFAQSSLLASALPELEAPDLRTAWTIDPALTLARRIEQALAHVNADEADWARVQRQIGEDLQELQRALSALGHQAPAEPSEWGFVVHIIFHNRPERPDQLALRLADDIHQRGELLTAKESAVLENYLQAEIASEVQRLLRAAEAQVRAINKELHKRPTSTGVRYRLQWQPLGEDEGAPVGLEAARQRLLNTSADLWSIDDRRVVGTMLQQRIAAERERADADAGRPAGGDAGGSLVDQLARALDYRRWHRFRVERSQDGQWRKLSGPASSGERALGLTVPLFAAVASFYSQGSNPHAPRLMLLDEAFAGIDDAARAHCMGLIREFDLDFVITSEREWACYAELPGVSICQLQRREGIDAVFVSRWTWDGRAKRREDDPDRRFAPA